MDTDGGADDYSTPSALGLQILVADYSIDTDGGRADDFIRSVESF